MKRLTKIVAPIVIVAAAVASAGYLKATRPVVEPTLPEERAWPVTVVSAARVDAQPELRLFGEIVAGREVELRPLVAGTVIDVGPRFLNGGVVREGELLIAIDPFDYRADVDEFEARIAESKARVAEIGATIAATNQIITHDREQLALSRADVDRREKLAGTAAVSKKALDDSRLALSRSEQQLLTRGELVNRLAARVDEEQAVLARWKVSLRRARRDLERTRLVAPFDGFLIDTETAIGKRVGVGDPIARLIDAGRLEAKFHLSDRAFARLLAAGGYQGRSARVVWRLAGSGIVHDAVIDRLESEIDATSGGVELYARLDGVGVDTVLRPGAFVEVRVPDRIYADVVRLPERALHQGDTVYTVVDDRLEPRVVEVVVRSGEEVFVRGDLAPDDRIVTVRFPEIGPGVRVAVR